LKKTKHHYIPKLILRNFANSKNQIFLYRHGIKKIICSSINDAFAENNLNSIINKDGIKDQNTIEDIYDKYFENEASLSIKKIISDLKIIPPLGKDFSAKDFLTLLRFCVLSHSRPPYALEEAHHSSRVSAYAIIFLKYFLDFGKVDFPYDIDINKASLFRFIEYFDTTIKMLVDLKLTLYYHSLPDEYFIIPDQYVIIYSPNNSKFGDKDLKMYFPISSNVVVCFERVERYFYKGTCEIDAKGVEEFNYFFLRNSYESFGCMNYRYLDTLIEKYKMDLIPLKRFNPYSDFENEKQQIKNEIISKLVLNINGDNFEDSIITSINKDHEFKILTEKEFEKIKKEMNSVIEIKNRVMKM